VVYRTPTAGLRRKNEIAAAWIWRFGVHALPVPAAALINPGELADVELNALVACTGNSVVILLA
jgi:hypothetical protein